MSSVLLRHLYQCEDGKTITFAQDSTGQLVNIDTVKNGNACNCVCPCCGRPMTARQGEIKIHHFAHQNSNDTVSCDLTTAGETSLHKIAKKYLNQDKTLTLPRLIARGKNNLKSKTIINEDTSYTFDNTILEKKLGPIIPDVLVIKDEHPLIIEFKVYHACNSVKIAKIRELNISAIEIDLSHLLERDITTLKPDILHKAPRIWLHNVRKEKEAQNLTKAEEIEIEKQEAERQKKQKELKKRTDVCFKAYSQQPPDLNETLLSYVAPLHSDFSPVLGVQLVGNSCFDIAPEIWQGWIIQSLFDDPSSPLKPNNILREFRDRGWIKPDLSWIAKDVYKALKNQDENFSSPIETINRYIKTLEYHKYLSVSDQREIKPSQNLEIIFKTITERIQQPHKRYKHISDMIDCMTSPFPEKEKAHFSIPYWIENNIMPDGTTPMSRIISDTDDEWKNFCHRIFSLQHNLITSLDLDNNFFNLPFHGQYHRTIEASRQKLHHLFLRLQTAHQNSIDRREKAINEEIEQFCVYGRKILGSSAFETFFRAPNNDLGGQTPIAILTSTLDNDHVFHALESHHQNILNLEKARVLKSKYISMALDRTKEKFKKPGHAELFMKTTKKELYGITPNDFIKDEDSYNFYLTLLK